MYKVVVSFSLSICNYFINFIMSSQFSVFLFRSLNDLERNVTSKDTDLDQAIISCGFFFFK